MRRAFNLCGVCSGLRWNAAKPPGPGWEVTKDSESHPDFKPKVVVSDASKEEVEHIKKDILDSIKSEEVVLFMKGVPEAPECMFSKRIVDVLEELGLEYTSFDCLAHPVIRTFVKEVSDWPTIPQLFVKGNFVGGVDIVLDMAQKGELVGLLDRNKISHMNRS